MIPTKAFDHHSFIFAHTAQNAQDFPPASVHTYALRAKAPDRTGWTI